MYTAYYRGRDRATANRYVLLNECGGEIRKGGLLKREV